MHKEDTTLKHTKEGWTNLQYKTILFQQQTNYALTKRMNDRTTDKGRMKTNRIISIKKWPRTTLTKVAPLSFLYIHIYIRHSNVCYLYSYIHTFIGIHSSQCQWIHWDGCVSSTKTKKERKQTNNQTIHSWIHE